MKTNMYYNFNGYLNTASLLRERVLADDYLSKSLKSNKNNLLLRQKTISEIGRQKSISTNKVLETKPSSVSNVKSILSVHTNQSSDSLSLLYALRDKNNKKLFTGFNYNEKFEEFLRRRKVSNKTLEKSLEFENKKMKERIQRIHSPLSKENLIREYDGVNKPVLKRIQKVYPTDEMNFKIKNFHKKVKVLNLK